MYEYYIRMQVSPLTAWLCWELLPVYCLLYCQILYNASSAMKIPNTMPLTVAALYSSSAVGSVFVAGYGCGFAPAVSLLYLMIFAKSAIVGYFLGLKYFLILKV